MAGGNWKALGPGQFGLYGFIVQETWQNSYQISIGGLNSGELYQIDVLDGGPGKLNIFDMTLGASNLVANTDGQGGDTLFRTRASGGQITFQALAPDSRSGCSIMGFYVTPIVTPPTPTGVQAVADLANQEVIVSWNPSPGAYAYQLWRSTSPGAEVLFLSSYGATNYTETVTYGPTYYYKVAAFNAVGTSAISGEVSASLVVPTVPPAPTGLLAAAGNGQISLSWNASTGATRYNVKRSTTLGAEVTITNLTATTYTNTGLANGTKYYYVVTATNSAGESGPSMEVNATPGIAPPAPTGLRAATTNGQIILTWTAVAGATSYNVKHSMSSGGSYVTDYSTLTPSCSYNVYSLNAGTTYYFEVSAVNNGAESVNSSWVSAMTPPPPPTGLAAVGGNGQVTLSWTPEATNAQSYRVFRSLIAPFQGIMSWSTNIANPTTAGYTDTNVVNGTMYYYAVSAVSIFTGESSLSSVVSALPAVNLVINGGFETGDFTGWTPGDGFVDDGSGSGIPPHSGNFEVDLMGGYLSQTLPTTPGANYLISFWVNNSLGDQNYSSVSWNGATVFGPTSIPATGWTNIQLQVTATGANTTLQFDFEDWDMVLGLDDVAVGLMPNVTAPPAVTGLRAVAGDGQITLTWNASPGALYYMVLRGTNSGTEGNSVATLATNYTDTMVTNGIKYYYVVAARNNSEAAYVSSEVSATPGAPIAPTSPKLGGITFTRGGGGSGFGFSFTNVPGASFSVYTSTNLALPLSNWTVLGHPIEATNGSCSQYQFTDQQATNKNMAWRFYRVSSQ